MLGNGKAKLMEKCQHGELAPQLQTVYFFFKDVILQSFTAFDLSQGN